MRNAILAVSCLAALAAGQVVFQRTYGGRDAEYGYAVRQPREGGYIMVGKTESYGAGDFDVWLVRTDQYGDTMWTRTYGGPDIDGGRSVAQTPDDGYIVAASTKSFGAGDWDAWLIKTDSAGLLAVEERGAARHGLARATICRGMLPLPGKQEADLLDIAGRRVMSLQPGENDISRLSPGVYFVHARAEGAGMRTARKVVIQK